MTGNHSWPEQPLQVGQRVTSLKPHRVDEIAFGRERGKVYTCWALSLPLAENVAQRARRSWKRRETILGVGGNCKSNICGKRKCNSFGLLFREASGRCGDEFTTDGKGHGCADRRPAASLPGAAHLQVDGARGRSAGRGGRGLVWTQHARRHRDGAAINGLRLLKRGLMKPEQTQSMQVKRVPRDLVRHIKLAAFDSSLTN